MVSAEKIPIGIDRIVEASIPFAALGVGIGEPVQFFVELREATQSRDRAPRDGEIHLDRPSAAFESLNWNA